MVNNKANKKARVREQRQASRKILEAAWHANELLKRLSEWLSPAISQDIQSRAKEVLDLWCMLADLGTMHAWLPVPRMRVAGAVSNKHSLSFLTDVEHFTVESALLNSPDFNYCKCLRGVATKEQTGDLVNRPGHSENSFYQECM
eukprot:1156278-Pelagomonas_calceolata.AAC.2